MNIALRPLTAADTGRLLGWRNAPHVREAMYADGAISPAEHEAWMAATLSVPDRRSFVMLLDEAPVGLAGLSRINLTARRCDWGFYIGEPEARGRGAALGALSLLLDLAFGALGLNKVWGEVLAGNLASRTLHERLGFTLEARLRDQAFREGGFEDAFGYGLLARDWPTARREVAARLRAQGADLPAPEA